MQQFPTAISSTTWEKRDLNTVRHEGAPQPIAEGQPDV